MKCNIWTSDILQTKLVLRLPSWITSCSFQLYLETHGSTATLCVIMLTQRNTSLILVFFKSFSLINMSPILEALQSANGQYQTQLIHKEQKCLEWTDNNNKVVILFNQFSVTWRYSLGSPILKQGSSITKGYYKPYIMGCNRVLWVYCKQQTFSVRSAWLLSSQQQAVP